MPAPEEDDPSDDEILRYLDGAATSDELDALANRLKASPFASARADIVAEALAEFDDPDPYLHSKI